MKCSECNNESINSTVQLCGDCFNKFMKDAINTSRDFTWVETREGVYEYKKKTSKATNTKEDKDE